MVSMACAHLHKRCLGTSASSSPKPEAAAHMHPSIPPMQQQQQWPGAHHAAALIQRPGSCGCSARALAATLLICRALLLDSQKAIH